MDAPEPGTNALYALLVQKPAARASIWRARRVDLASMAMEKPVMLDGNVFRVEALIERVACLLNWEVHDGI
ncbi:MAG: hypothetical protein WCB79_05410 [Halobacteriota archaeon]